MSESAPSPAEAKGGRANRAPLFGLPHYFLNIMSLVWHAKVGFDVKFENLQEAYVLFDKMCGP